MSIGGVLERLLAEPEGIMKILSLVSRFAASSGGGKGEGGGGGIKIPDGLFDGLPEDAEEAEAVFASQKDHDVSCGECRDNESERRCALLLALRPYVSDSRQRAIDLMVGFTRLSAFLPLDYDKSHKNFEECTGKD